MRLVFSRGYADSVHGTPVRRVGIAPRSKLPALQRGLHLLRLSNFVVTAEKPHRSLPLPARELAPLPRIDPHLLWAMRAKWHPSAGRRSPS